MTLQHNDLTIKLFDDSSYLNHSIDSPTHYDIVYNKYNYDDHDFPTRHAIKIFKAGKLFKSAILLGAGGATSVTCDAALIDHENLIIRCSNQLFSLTLPGLNKNWQIEADCATCFSVHKYQDTYITHGETSISRIDKAGKILWSFSGADIFVCIYEGNPFEMHDSYIALTDFNGNKYKIDYDGKSLDYKKPDCYKQPLITNKKNALESLGKTVVNFTTADFEVNPIYHLKDFGPLSLKFSDNTFLTFENALDGESVIISSEPIENLAKSPTHWKAIELIDNENWKNFIGLKIESISFLHSESTWVNILCGCQVIFNGGKHFTYFNSGDDIRISFGETESLKGFLDHFNVSVETHII